MLVGVRTKGVSSGAECRRYPLVLVLVLVLMLVLVMPVLAAVAAVMLLLSLLALNGCLRC